MSRTDPIMNGFRRSETRSTKATPEFDRTAKQSDTGIRPLAKKQPMVDFSIELRPPTAKASGPAITGLTGAELFDFDMGDSQGTRTENRAQEGTIV